MQAFIRSCATVLGALCVGLAAAPAGAGNVAISGNLDVVLVDDGSGAFGGTPLGTAFSGFIDDVSFNGQLSNGSTTVSFGCCIAAGGLEVFNNQVLTADTAAVLNQLAGASVYAAGGVVDSLNIEGDVATASDGRIEIGVSYVFASDTFADNSVGNYPFDPNAVQLALFFVLEQDSASRDIYHALGRMPFAAIPEPATLVLLLGGLAMLPLVRRSHAAAA